MPESGSACAAGVHPRPRLLDLFCGQSGAGWGYHLAGFQVTGVDIRPQPHHPPELEFVHGDWREYLRTFAHQFDAVHASPPCRAYTKATGGTPVKYRHPDLVAGVRDALMETGLPWVIENVPGAPLEGAVELCGAMFGLRTYRHRRLEFSVADGLRGRARTALPPHPPHVAKTARMGRRPGEGEFWSIAGNFSGVQEAGRVMGMEWANQDGLRQAVPPAYARWAGNVLLDGLAKSRQEVVHLT